MPPEEKLNPSTLPSGHKRDEARKIVADQLEEQIEKNNAAAGIESVSEAKLDQRDNEILRHLILSGPETGSVPVKNKQPGYRYAFFTVADGYGSSAQANIRMMHSAATRYGFEPVSGKSPEAEDLIGEGRASGTSLRGVGDTILERIPEHRAQEMDAIAEEKNRRANAIEEQSLMLAERYGVRTMHAARGTFAGQDPLMAQVAGEAGYEEKFRMTTQVSEGDLRRGSMRGPDGRIIQPGYETRRMR